MALQKLKENQILLYFVRTQWFDAEFEYDPQSARQLLTVILNSTNSEKYYI